MTTTRDDPGGRAASRWLALALALLGPAVQPGCTCSSPGGPGPGAGASSSAATAAVSASASASSSAEVSTHDDQVQPVYPPLKGEPHPLAVRLCGAVHGLPSRRRAECCERAAGLGVEAECLRNVTGALAGGGVTLDEAAVGGCEKAMAEALQGCDWVAPFPLAPPTPAACQGLFQGKRAKGAVCRSALECQDGGQCAGLGPTTTGRCAPPRAAGGCHTVTDPLAIHARQDDAERAHPSCTGFCNRGQCAPFAKDGEACAYNDACGPGHHCDKGVCKPGQEGKAGEPCLGTRCAAGLRCDEGKCVAPRRENEACERDAQCRGACVQGPGEKDGRRCAARCSFPSLRPTVTGGVQYRPGGPPVAPRK